MRIMLALSFQNANDFLTKYEIMGLLRDIFCIQRVKQEVLKYTIHVGLRGCPPLSSFTLMIISIVRGREAVGK